MEIDICPCGTGKKYKDCCEPYISGSIKAVTAEQLMRARYSAYVTCNVDFIESTHQQEGRDDLSVEATRKWAEESKWLGLEIVSTEKGLESDKTGVVEFIASYESSGHRRTHHETAVFEKEEGQWVFVEGKVYNETIVRASEKVGRNDPCTCGSGKKFKKCCG